MKLFSRGTTENSGSSRARQLALTLTAVSLAVVCWNLPSRAQEHGAPAHGTPAAQAPHSPTGSPAAQHGTSAAPEAERGSHQGAAEPGPGGQHAPQTGGEHEVGTPGGQPNTPGHGPEAGDHGAPAAGGEHGMPDAPGAHGTEGDHGTAGHAAEGGHGEGEHGEEGHGEEKAFSIHLPSWIYGPMKKFWYSGPATLNAAGALDAQGQPLRADQLKALQGQSLDYTYVDHHAHSHPLPKYEIKPTLGSIGESKMGGTREQITVGGQTITLLDPTVTFKLEKLFPELLVISLLTALTIALVSFLLTRNMQRVPGRAQVLVESIYTFFDGFVRDLIGPHYKRYLPLMLALFLYILFMNWGGLIPGWASATANINVAAGLAVVIVAYVQFEGIRVNGPVGYLKHFVGEPWWLFWLNIPLHVVGELAKALSLTIRLFGNIFGEDVVIVILISLAVMFTKGFVPFQAPMYLLALFTGFVQALVFMILSCVYIQLFTSHDEEGHGHGEEHGHHAHGEDDHTMKVPSAASMPATPA